MAALRRARGLKPVRKSVPPTLFPRPVEHEYAKRLVEIVRLFGRAYRVELGDLALDLQVSRAELGPNSAVLKQDSLTEYMLYRRDATSDRIRAMIARAAQRLQEQIPLEEVERLAREFAIRTETWQRVQMQRQVRAALGVDLFIGDRWLATAADHWVQENVELVKGLSDKLRADLATTIYRAVGEGRLWPQVAKEIEQRIGVAEDRARRIARDQVGKMYGKISAARHQELGLTHFYWRCVDDVRVRGRPDGKYPSARPSHWARDGKRYAYSDPPRGRDNEPELPGTPINCRCVAQPDFDSILQDEDHEQVVIIR